MRVFPILGVVAFVAACASDVPNAAEGVGFKDYDTYLQEKARRDAALAAQTAPPGTQTVQPPVIVVAERDPNAVQPTAPQSDAEATASAALAAIGAENASSQEQAVVLTENAEISDEQDFAAVSGRQTIESDAQRRQAQSEQYTQVQPKALPSRPSTGVLTPAEFAVRTSHPIGQKLYRRSPLKGGRAAQKCAAFDSVEKAQDAFLKAGGPERDRLGIDPDGDGYACQWSPELYRNAIRRTSNG